VGPAMTLEAPPKAVHAAAPASRISAAEVQHALARLRAANPGTTFVSAEPSQVSGLLKLTLAGGKLAYADKSGRYLFMGVIFDMDVGKALDGALDAVPQTSIGDSRND
jgi:hypothetical protein